MFGYSKPQSVHLFRAALLLFGLFILPAAGHSQRRDKTALRRGIAELQEQSGARIGVAAMRFSGGPADSLLFNGTGQLPMQSVYKLPLALAVLDEVAKGKLSLTQTVIITHEELDSNTWSPMAKLHPDGDFTHTIAELLRFTVSQSDNNACDVLFRLIGGPKSVQRYLDQKNLTGIRVLSTEKEMHRDSKLQYRNWSTPAGMLHLLQRIHRGDLLQGETAAFLNIALTESENSPKRIKGNLPDVPYRLAHKTGTSGTNAQGFTAAVNDVGILMSRNVDLGVVVFFSDFHGDVAAGEEYIAKISRMLWDYYLAE